MEFSTQTDSILLSFLQSTDRKSVFHLFLPFFICFPCSLDCKNPFLLAIVVVVADGEREESAAPQTQSPAAAQRMAAAAAARMPQHGAPNPRQVSPFLLAVLVIGREEKNVQKAIREAAKRNDIVSAKALAKEIVRSRRAINRLHENKAQLNSISMHLGESVGHLSKSAEVMKIVNNLMKAPEVAATMLEFSKEMTKCPVPFDPSTQQFRSAIHASFPHIQTDCKDLSLNHSLSLLGKRHSNLCSFLTASKLRCSTSLTGNALICRMFFFAQSEDSAPLMEAQNNSKIVEAGVIEEMVNDAVDTALDSEDIEEETEEEVDKVLTEIAGETAAQLPEAVRRKEKMKQPAREEAAQEQEAIAEGVDDEEELEEIRARLARVLGTDLEPTAASLSSPALFQLVPIATPASPLLPLSPSLILKFLDGRCFANAVTFLYSVDSLIKGNF
ncbi:hypothetical protein ACLOJK_015858 [Asimina triloba]